MDKILRNKKISAISLGCDKNRVDLEKMLFRLQNYGFEIVASIDDADIAIVNTCAFIEPSRKESLDNIFDVCLHKSAGKLEKVIVSGCLSQRYAKELQKQLPEVDAFLSAEDNENVCEIIEDLYNVKHLKKKKELGRVFTNRGSYAYLKIAEGCNNVCSYCTIPRIKGRYVSYDMDDLVAEAKYLAKNGIKELVLVAQDVTRYGEDLYGENSLIKLCKKLAKIEGIEWIRLHYAYPEKTTEELLKYIEKEPKMCKYLDIPLQHISKHILSSMRRRLNEVQTRQLVADLQEKHPQIALRTTFIVGYPGETKADFKNLCEFLQEARFDYAGFFPYYREENTPSYYMKKQHCKLVKNLRLKKVESLQHKIATQKAREKIGQVFKVLVDYFDEQTGLYFGHTEFLSPSVDFGVKIEDNNNVTIGRFVNVKFTDFDGENFKGEYYEFTK